MAPRRGWPRFGALGLIDIIGARGTKPEQLAAAGGWIGHQLSSVLATLVSEPGAFVVLLGMLVVGILLLFNLTVRSLIAPLTSGGRALAAAMAQPLERDA